MLRNTSCIVCGFMLAGALFSGPSLWAQEAVLSHFYGSGVHNYYERDYFEAKAQLSAAIDGGSQDPRVYYYRALANMRTGNSLAAQRDLEKGAGLESADVNQFYPVGKSLERVQGSERMMLERYRALARAKARQRQLIRDQARYEERRRAEADVLRNVPLGPPPAPLQPPAVAPAAAAEPAPGPAAPAPPKPAPAGGATPFDAPGADEMPAEDSPFGEAPADEMPAADSPFGDAPADAAPAAEPAADDPFGDAATDDNPFGDEP